jgi:hypothetical protein
MKLVRCGAAGAEKPGVIDTAGAVRDLSGVVADLDAAALSPEGLKTLAAIDPETLPKAPEGARLGPPLAFEREFQIERGPTWDKGEGCDTFCPLGPWLVTKYEVPDPQNYGGQKLHLRRGQDALEIDGGVAGVPGEAADHQVRPGGA